MGGVSGRFSSSPVGWTILEALLSCCLQICTLKNVPKTTSIPYEWCPSLVPKDHKSEISKGRINNDKLLTRLFSNQTLLCPSAADGFFCTSIKHLLLKLSLRFPFAYLYSHFLLGRCSPKCLRSSQTGKLEDKVKSGSPSAPGFSPTGRAEMTNLWFAASLGAREKVHQQ